MQSKTGGTVSNYLSLIKFSHTVFALPFAVIGFLLGAKSVNFQIHWSLAVKVLLCMVFARSAAMAFNRWADRKIDNKNPRTKMRELPAGIISENSALLFTIINCLLFVSTTWFINSICFYLSPIALIVVLGYSYTKRFTALCHLVLGLGLALAPIGAYLAVTGKFDWEPLLFSFAVFSWVSGFDIIYALQDDEFDKANGLNSIPSLVGRNSALMISRILHLLTAVILFFAVNYGSFNWGGYIGLLLFTCLLIYQHLLVKPNDLSKVNIAFFTTNGIASTVFAVILSIGMFLG